MFGLSILAVMDPRFISFSWLKLVYSNDEDWPKFTDEYPDQEGFKSEVIAEVSFEVALLIKGDHDDARERI